MSEKCPNCQTNSFIKVPDLSVDIQNTLKQWEIETKTRFSDETRKEYSKYKKSEFFKCQTCLFGTFFPSCAGTSSFYNDITIEDEYYVSDKWEFIKSLEIIKNLNIKSLLDFGCGGGAFLKKIKINCKNVSLSGYDQNPQSSLRIESDDILFYQNLENIPSQSFDMITAFQIFEHLEDPYSAIKKLYSFLNKDGLIIISVPNTLGPIRFFPFALTEIPPHHVNRFNKPSLEIFLNNAGFKVKDISYEPLSKILWSSYLPVIIKNSLPPLLHPLFNRLRLSGAIYKISKILEKTPLSHLPLKGHSIYVVAQKCVE